MNANFTPWWRFCQWPQHDGSANDTAPGEPWQTRWGFTFPTWITARRWVGYRDCTQATFEAATQADMGDLAHRFFWSRQGGDEIPAGADMCTIDWLWTSGGAVYDIQRHLGFQGADIDGLIGPRTVRRITDYGKPMEYAAAVTRWRLAYYDDLGLAAQYPGLYARAQDCLTIADEVATT